MRGARRHKGGWRVPAVAIAAIAAISVPLFAASSAGATRSEFYGIVQTATLDNQDAQGLLNARVRTNRFVLKWGWVEPNANSFDWDSADAFIGGLAFYGIRTVPSLWGNPDWVPGSGSTPPIGGATGENAWRAFLRAMAGRYGPGGTYWQGPYHQDFGANATPLPIQSWQIWNEPNLKKFFAPYPSPGKYAHLLQISRDALRSKDPKARLVMAGMPAHGDVNAWDFLRDVYKVQNIKNFFDAAALHPYAPTISEMQQDIQKFRQVMKSHNDAATPLWITELAWGSAPPDQFGINKGLQGQATMLKRAYNLILDHRAAWNIERLFWYHWRDPLNTVASCSFCGSAGLFRHDRTAKLAYAEFRKFTADNTKPAATLTQAPQNAAYINDPTPTFKFTSSEHGSTFVCSAGGALKPCSSPFTAPNYADGTRSFVVRAIDAAGNDSPFAGRYFFVDTRAPAVPKITATNPASPANNNLPKVIGNAGAGTTVKIYKNVACTGSPSATGTASAFHSTGIAVPVPNNATTKFRAKATDRAGNSSGCSAAFSYVEDSIP